MPIIEMFVINQNGVETVLPSPKEVKREIKEWDLKISAQEAFVSTIESLATTFSDQQVLYAEKERLVSQKAVREKLVHVRDVFLPEAIRYEYKVEIPSYAEEIKRTKDIIKFDANGQVTFFDQEAFAMALLPDFVKEVTVFTEGKEKTVPVKPSEVREWKGSMFRKFWKKYEHILSPSPMDLLFLSDVGVSSDSSD